MRRTAPTVQQLLGTWRWAYRTGEERFLETNGEAESDYAWLATKGSPTTISSDVCASTLVAYVLVPLNATSRERSKIPTPWKTIDMTDDPQKQHHANVDKITSKLCFMQ
ncbi:MAG: hypothetical protein FRX48_01870 [Lasallia pustulata]|uniref:Uncharacterized protein n=1 Tax=Lasallia pustulata TaxID=136370 RepID=A0A5M8Q1Y4_9LECA|nr:MAG: hypothetical protein FRX48_01870 [Lasallia pustulata]